MNSFPLAGFVGYTSKTLSYKTTSDGDISVDVVYPEETDGSPSTVVIHYHGGFLIIGDRYSFLPYWLVHACTSRKWIFVTPEYRLIPETTAHSAVEDAVDAYEWVRSSLPGLLGRSIGSVLVSGSSAGGYLALTTGTLAKQKPEALLPIYGMLDPAGSRYTTPGSSIFGQAVFDTKPILQRFPKKENEDRKSISACPQVEGSVNDPRFSLAAALHIDALFPDYITGVDGLSRALADEGIKAIPEKDKKLFPLSFGNLVNLPRTFLLHGVNDSAVPIENSVTAAEKLRAATSSEIITEFPEDAEHGFDSRIGNVNVEGKEGDKVLAVESLRRAIQFLESSVLKP